MILQNKPHLDSLYCPTHLSAGLGANEASNGTEVVIVSANEYTEKGGLCSAPVYVLGRIRNLQFHWSLAAGIRLYTQTNIKTYKMHKQTKLRETCLLLHLMLNSHWVAAALTQQNIFMSFKASA